MPTGAGASAAMTIWARLRTNQSLVVTGAPALGGCWIWMGSEVCHHFLRWFGFWSRPPSFSPEREHSP